MYEPVNFNARYVVSKKYRVKIGEVWTGQYECGKAKS